MVSFRTQQPLSERKIKNLKVSQWNDKISNLLNNNNIGELNKQKLKSVLLKIKTSGYLSDKQAGMVLKIEANKDKFTSKNMPTDEDWKILYKEKYKEQLELVFEYWLQKYNLNKQCIFNKIIEHWIENKDKENFILPKHGAIALLTYSESQKFLKSYKNDFKFTTDDSVFIIDCKENKKLLPSGLPYKQVLGKPAFVFKREKIIDVKKYDAETSIYGVMPAGSTRIFYFPENNLKKL